MFMRLAFKSLVNRKGSVLLTLMAMTVSIFVLLGVEHIRHQAKESFGNTVSGVDLIVGARTGSLNLLLYSVFHIGTPTNNISWESFEDIASDPNVEWTIPIALGDSHKGFRVMGTAQDYFEHFSYGNRHKLEFTQGKPFSDVFDVVLGSEVAKKLGYGLGDQLVLAHGIAATSFSLHDDRPFTVVGILAPTGTPVDQTLHVSLRGIEAIHIDWQQGVKMPGSTITIAQIEQMDLTPKSITAFLVGLKSRIATFSVQRQINNFAKEPLSAILPGAALSELWQMMSVLENTLRLVSLLVLVSSLLGLSAMLLASIREREREVILLRSIGASPLFLFLLIELEALFVSIAGIALGAGLLSAVLMFLQGYFVSHFGLSLSMNIFSGSSLFMLAVVLVLSAFSAAIPAVSVYRRARSCQA